MGIDTIGLDALDVEQRRVGESARAACSCCAGTGYLNATSIKDPPVRACEYCGGKGWTQLVPFEPEAYWDA